MKKNILLLDTNISAKPIYDYLVSTGNRVFVAGGNSHDALAKSSENYINIDYSKISDVERVVHEESIDFLVPGGNDMSYKISSIISEKYNFFNIDSAEINEIINNKEKFRKQALKLRLNTPLIINNQNQISNDMPIIVKPVDAYSGHGITVIKKPDSESIEKAIKQAVKYSKTKNYLIEEFVEGQLYSHSAFIAEHKIINDFIVEEHCVVNEFAVDTSRVINDFDQLLLDSLRNNIERLATELNLQDGLMHTQFISNGQNFWIIEVTRRCPGDLYSLLIELSTGFPYAAYYANPFLNIKNKQIKNIESNFNVFRHTLTVAEKIHMHYMNYNFSFKMIRYFPYSLAGDSIKESPFGRIGIIFGQLDDITEFDMVYKNIINKTLYSIG